MTKADALTYWVIQGPPQATPEGIIVSGVGTGPISWERDRPEWEHNRRGMYSAMSRAGRATPIPLEQLDPKKPVQPIDRPTAVQIAAAMGLTLPEEPDLWAMIRAGMAKRDAQRWQASLIRAYGRPRTSHGRRTGFQNSPEEKQLTFYASYPTDTATEANGLAIVQPWTAYMRSVTWAPKKRKWVFLGGGLLDFLLSQDNYMRKAVVDRETAEQISLRITGGPLPTEEEITRICDEAIVKLPGGRKELGLE